MRKRVIRLAFTMLCFAVLMVIAETNPVQALGFPCYGCASSCAEAEGWCDIYCGMPPNDECVLDEFEFCEGTPFIWVVGCQAPD